MLWTFRFYLESNIRLMQKAAHVSEMKSRWLVNDKGSQLFAIPWKLMLIYFSCLFDRILQEVNEENDHININCVDPLGRSALLMAIDNENLEMVELLINYNVDTKDALLHAISEEFVEAVEMLLDHEDGNSSKEGHVSVRISFFHTFLIRFHFLVAKNNWNPWRYYLFYCKHLNKLHLIMRNEYMRCNLNWYPALLYKNMEHQNANAIIIL